MSFSSDDTGEYDLATYAFCCERMEALRLPCLWKITPLRKGAMLIMNRNDEHESIFVQSPKALKTSEQVIIDWATGTGFNTEN